MLVTLVVGEQERQIVPTGASRWARADDSAPLARDERDLLDELTQLCQEILLAEDEAFLAEDPAAD